MDGASVVEEVEQVLVKLTDTLSTMKATRAGVRPLRLTVLHHASDAEGIKLSALRPFKKPRADKTRFAYAPMLNLDPQRFLI